MTPQTRLSDDQVWDIYDKSHMQHVATVLVVNEFTLQEEYKKESRSYFSPSLFHDNIVKAYGLQFPVNPV